MSFGEGTEAKGPCIGLRTPGKMAIYPKTWLSYKSQQPSM